MRGLLGEAALLRLQRFVVGLPLGNLALDADHVADRHRLRVERANAVQRCPHAHQPRVDVCDLLGHVVRAALARYLVAQPGEPVEYLAERGRRYLESELGAGVIGRAGALVG
jgi:hypothetical protein